jgi:hypothetical protein
VQSFFHPEIFETMMKVNSLKSHVDFENGTCEKQSWSSLADLYNSSDPDDALDSLDVTLDADDKGHLVSELAFDDTNVTDFTQTPTGGAGLKKFFNTMFKFR